MIVFYFQVSVNFIGIFSDCGADRNIHELPGNGEILGHIPTMEGYTISNITAFCLKSSLVSILKYMALWREVDGERLLYTMFSEY